MHRSGLTSPRSGMPLIPVDPDSPRIGGGGGGGGGGGPSRRLDRSSSGFLSSWLGKKGEAGRSALTLSLLLTLLLLHIATLATLVVRTTPSRLHTVAAVDGTRDPTAFHAVTPATGSSDTVSSELLLEARREVTALQTSLITLRTELSQLREAERVAKEQAREALLVRDELAQKVTDLQTELESAASGAVVPAATQAAADCPCKHWERLSKDDLATQHFDFRLHEFEWQCDENLAHPTGNQTFCPETATNEQYFQLTFFDRPGAGSKVAIRGKRPVSPTCVQLPPRGYKWPDKYAPIPVEAGQAGAHWPNLRVEKLEDLLVFNERTPKNLYHFNASFYDYEQEAIVAHAAKFIPFQQKIRLALDVGAGGGSMGLLLKRRYDVQTVSTVFADWPYVEYISERGGIGMYVDSMEAMPFAKFTFDMVHSSWVFHALLNHQLVNTFLEHNRLLRPGGYMWLNGGWSNSQVATLENLFFKQLGYHLLYQRKKKATKSGTFFDTVPFELEWEAIMVKPIRAEESTCRVAQERHSAMFEKKDGKVKA